MVFGVFSALSKGKKGRTKATKSKGTTARRIRAAKKAASKEKCTFC